MNIDLPNEHTPFVRIGGDGIIDSPPSSLPLPSCTSSGGIPCESDGKSPIQQTCSGGCGLCSFHQGCDGFEKSRTPECVAATSRFCKTICSGCGGVIQQVNGLGGVFGVSCFRGRENIVSVEDLSRHHPGCAQPSLSQSNDCIAAVNRWCFKNGQGSNGIPQEVGVDEFAVSCFDASWYGTVLLLDLTSRFVLKMYMYALMYVNYIC